MRLNFFKGSLTEKVLGYLVANGGLRRKDLYVPFSDYEYTRYTRVVKRFIDEGYAEVYKADRCDHIRVTAAGVEALREKQGADAAKPKKPSNAKGVKRQQLVAPVIGLCHANGFAYAGEEKPALESLFETGAPEPEDKKRDFDDLLQNGVFYTSGEIRTALMKVTGSNDLTLWTRLIGVVLLKENLTFIYSVGDALIQWVSSREESAVSAIARFLLNSPVISQHITFYRKPNCIVCGKGFTMIPKIVYGRTWGRVDEEKDLTKLARDHINSHNLGKVFAFAYYVTVDRRGIDDFKLACLLDEAKREEICDKWFEKVGTATRIKNYAYHQGLTAKRERVVYMPYIDLIELEFYQKQNVPCHFVIPRNTQEGVARVMGPLLLSARSLDGMRLKHNQYDKLGIKMFPQTTTERKDILRSVSVSFSGG